eukprot:Anaeramoba_ignava/c21072_g1_i1.p2 GENE.c21072_g1_i1~~c21072_g1_i1.p2  ORF type:complete len:251 (+),score=80.02 c21072_g1_i1:36-788(+)
MQYNKQLPYYEQIKDEEDKLLEHIKLGLIQAFCLQDNPKGSSSVISCLSKYLSFGYRPPEKEQSNIIRLLIEFLKVPDIDSHLAQGIIAMLNRLIKKNPEKLVKELKISWRELYNLIVEDSFQKTRAEENDKGIGIPLISFVENARKFFPESSTKEILEEFKPMLCIHDSSLMIGQGFLCLFLTTWNLKNFPIWFDYLLSVWDWEDNVGDWDGVFFGLYSRLIQDSFESLSVIRKQVDQKIQEYLPFFFF